MATKNESVMKKILTILLLLAVSYSLKSQTELNDYLMVAAEQNPSLKAKFSTYLAALERVNQNGTLPDPTVSFGYFISRVETRVGPQRFRLSVAQMFPWMGTLKVREQVASSMARVKFEEFEEARNMLFLKVKMKWLSLYELQKEVQIMEANLNILKSYEPVTKTKYEANLVSLADLVRVQISIDRAKIELELLSLKTQPLLDDFNTLLNREVTTKVTLPDTLIFENPILSFEAMLADQPRLKGVKAGLEVLENESKLAELKRKPNIGVGLDYGFIDRREGVNIQDNGKDILMPMVTMSLPIFGKKNRSLKKEVALRTEGLSSQLEAVENELKNDWTRTAYEIASAEKELELYLAELQKTDVLLRVLISEYTNNNRDFEALLQTQQRQLQLQLAQLRASARYYNAVFKKDYLTGYTLNEIQNETK